MRYAKYTFYIDPQTGIKTLPDKVNGVSFTSVDEFELVGYLDEDAEINLMANWSLSEIDQSEFLNLLLARNADVVLVNGKAVFPLLPYGNY
jgi:hypothetical protein